MQLTVGEVANGGCRLRDTMLKQIGKFTLSERIGRGTYSRVYRAVDPQGRPVAIKVSTTPTNQEQINEFQKDLVAAASVLHPNLVSVYDLGFEEEFPYLVMELVEGRDLDKLLKSQTDVSLADRIRIMQQVADALRGAHERGIFHLDIRPSKIMVTDDGAAKLLNLGLGRLSFDSARVTEHGYLIGSPFYMSPERLTAIDTSSAQCDIWSFGATFYEFLSGTHPFYDDDGDRMIGNIMDVQPVELPGVPAALNQILLKTLEKEPSERYSGFGELLRDLKPLAEDLHREESEALLAEALQQTDSGRWHEARRIARKLREMEPEAPAAQLFGGTEQPEGERVSRSVPPNPPISAPVSPVVLAAANVPPSIETPLPAPLAAQAPPPNQPVQSPPQSATSAGQTPAQPQRPTRPPQRPERTAPKIPTITARNAASSAEAAVSESNGRESRLAAAVAAASGLVAAAAVTNSPEVADRISAASTPPQEAARPARPTVAAGAETVSAPRQPEAARPVETTKQRAAAPAERPAQPQPTVRILQVSESSGPPWGKIAAVAASVLLVAGLGYFLLRPESKRVASANSDADGKIIGPSGRVIKAGSQKQADVPAFSDTARDARSVTTPATITPIPTVVNGVNPPAADQASLAGPKAFDPKSLVASNLPAPSRRRNGSAPSLVAPNLGGEPEAIDTNGLAMPIGVPPPPAPPKPAASVPPPPSSLPAATPSSGAQQPQTVEAAQAAALRIGGSFNEPVLVRTVQPVYPPAALQKRSQGTVRFQATITKDGSVTNLQLIAGDPLFNVAAKQAVMQWKYRPAVLNGQPVEVIQAIVVKFNLSR